MCCQYRHQLPTREPVAVTSGPQTFHLDCVMSLKESIKHISTQVCPSQRKLLNAERVSIPQTYSKKHDDGNPELRKQIKKKIDKPITLKKIQDYVCNGMAAYEEAINTRRERLRDMIRDEEAELTRELIDHEHQRVHAAAEDMRKREETRREKAEENRVALITRKREQQYLETCPEARDKLSREMTRGVKYSNLVQILEKHTRLQEDKQLDTLWNEMILRENEEHNRRQEQKQRMQRAAGREAGMVLLNQITGKISSEELRGLREQERQEVERLRVEMKAEEMRNLELERVKRLKLKKDLEEQLVSVKERLVERAQQEAETEHKLRVIYEEELMKERADIAESSARLQREMMAYMKSLEELRREKRRKESQVEAIIHQSMLDADAKRDLAIKRHRDKEKRILEEVIVARDKQLKDKLDIQEQERKNCLMEREMCRREAERESAAAAAEATEKRQMTLRYRQQLEAQQMTKCLQAKVDPIQNNDMLGGMSWLQKTH